MSASSWQVDLYDLREDEDALSELVEDDNLTAKQVAKVKKELDRLERHGPNLGSGFFENAEGSAKGVKEFKITADKVEIRFLYKLIGNVFLMLKGYTHKRKSDVNRHLPTAEARLDKWENRNAAR